jgi:hypothetical protein
VQGKTVEQTTKAKRTLFQRICFWKSVPEEPKKKPKLAARHGLLVDYHPSSQLLQILDANQNVMGECPCSAQCAQDIRETLSDVVVVLQEYPQDLGEQFYEDITKAIPTGDAMFIGSMILTHVRSLATTLFHETLMQMVHEREEKLHLRENQWEMLEQQLISAADLNRQKCASLDDWLPIFQKVNTIVLPKAEKKDSDQGQKKGGVHPARLKGILLPDSSIPS